MADIGAVGVANIEVPFFATLTKSGLQLTGHEQNDEGNGSNSILYSPSHGRTNKFSSYSELVPICRPRKDGRLVGCCRLSNAVTPNSILQVRRANRYMHLRCNTMVGSIERHFVAEFSSAQSY